jgi:Cation efflux family/Phage integrase family
VLLYVGVRHGARPADDHHPFGYGQARYLWSLLAAVGIFVVGGLFAIADAQTQGWTLLPGAQHPLPEAVDLHGAHDFRHTFATWLEDGGIPARVIDELMGHQAGRVGSARAA